MRDGQPVRRHRLDARRRGGDRVDVDTVTFGAFRPRAFEQAGRYDETLVRNQDDELNLRIRRAGGRIVLDPAISVSYTPRGSLRKVFRQYFEYGLWKVPVMRRHGQVLGARSLAPVALVGSVAALGPLTPWSARLRRLLALELTAYAAFAVVSAADSVRRRREPWRLLPAVIAVFPSFHVAYGLGMLKGWAHVRHGVPEQAPAVTTAGPRGVRKPFVRTTLLTFFTSQFGFATLSLVNVLIISRTLGPEGRGNVAFLTAIGWFTANLSTFGVQEAAVRRRWGRSRRSGVRWQRTPSSSRCCSGRPRSASLRSSSSRCRDRRALDGEPALADVRVTADADPRHLPPVPDPGRLRVRRDQRRLRAGSSCQRGDQRTARRVRRHLGRVCARDLDRRPALRPC